MHTLMTYINSSYFRCHLCSQGPRNRNFPSLLHSLFDQVSTSWNIIGHWTLLLVPRDCKLETEQTAHTGPAWHSSGKVCLHTMRLSLKTCEKCSVKAKHLPWHLNQYAVRLQSYHF